jgi:predicted dehydrogenase
MNSAEMKVLQQEAEKRSLIYFFSRQFRFTPAMRTAHELISRDELGTIYFARRSGYGHAEFRWGWADGLRRRNDRAAARSSTLAFMRLIPPGF